LRDAFASRWSVHASTPAQPGRRCTWHSRDTRMPISITCELPWLPPYRNSPDCALTDAKSFQTLLVLSSTAGTETETSWTLELATADRAGWHKSLRIGNGRNDNAGWLRIPHPNKSPLPSLSKENPGINTSVWTSHIFVQAAGAEKRVSSWRGRTVFVISN
jgi:hypothetical protein